MQFGSAMKTNLKESLLDKEVGDKLDEDEKVYISNKPKILLEVISARTAWVLIVATFLVFAIGCAIDLHSVVVSFTSSNRVLGGAICNSAQILGVATDDFGCVASISDDGAIVEWVGMVTDLENVISVQLELDLQNFTSIIGDNGTEYSIDSTTGALIDFEYSARIYCCYQPDGCGTSFSDDVSINAHSWYSMMYMDNETDSVYDSYDTNDQELSYVLFGYIFQNQEAIPTRGKVQSYFLEVQSVMKLDDETFRPNDGSQISYKFNVVTRDRVPAFDWMTLCLVVFTCIALYFYTKTLLEKQKKWLPEQTWLIWYLIAILLYQNPIYCIMDLAGGGDTGAAYSSYFIGFAGQIIFLVIWLLFADTLRYISITSNNNKLIYYAPKVVFGGVIFLCYLVILTLQFCSLDPHNKTRTPVESVYNWSNEVKTSFCAFSAILVALSVSWGLWWFYSIYYTGHVLQKLPYMSTRYLQLSFWFFSIQAVLVSLYYAVQYAVVLYYIFLQTRNEQMSLEGFAESSNTNLRQQTQLFGKVFFLTCFGLILAFLFLPAGVIDDERIAGLGNAYTITEEERTVVVKRRRKMIEHLAEKHFNLAQIYKAKADVFCIDNALMLLDAAYEAYYDVVGLETESGFGPMDIESHGFLLVDYFYESVHEMFCIVCRHSATGNLVVAFRGTSSKKNWSDNLNYSQMLFDISAYPMPTVDQSDGLEPFITHTNPKESGGTSDGESSDSEDEGTHDGQGHRKGVHKRRSAVVEAMNQSIHKAQDMIIDAARVTPLTKVVSSYIHCGFWDAYMSIREFVHRVVRKQLVEHPTKVFFTGHSLGGAVATLAAFDVKHYTTPRVNAYLLAMRRRHEGGTSPTEATTLATSSSGAASPMHNSSGQTSGPSSPKQITSSHTYPRHIHVTMYNFGCPRVGNAMFAEEYNSVVPDSFRVVVDGDAVPGIPKQGFKHGGVEILIDNLGAGSIIIDPSFVERRLRKQVQANLGVHSLVVYRKALLGVRQATEYIRSHAHQYSEDDHVKLAVHAGTLNAMELLGMSVTPAQRQEDQTETSITVEDVYANAVVNRVQESTSSTTTVV